MPIQLSKRVNSIKQSASIAAKKRVTQLQAEGRDIIDFTIGEPDLDTPAHIVDAAIQALRSGDTHYTATPGVPRLRALIAEKLTHEADSAYEPDQIVVGSGAKQLIYEAFMATLNPGDEVIVPAPYWVSYPDIVKLAEGVPVIAASDERSAFKLTPQALQASITPRSRWLILNSPGNPSGAVYDAQEIAALAQVLAAHPHIMVMTDDIYGQLAYDTHRHINIVAAAPALKERTLIINGFSKSYAMTGWRVGYAAGPALLVNAIAKLIGQSTTCVSSISQAGAIAALSGDHGFIEETRTLYKERRDLMHSIIASIPGVECVLPQGAFYLFPKVQGLMGKRTPQGAVISSDGDLVMYLLDAAGAAVMDGTSYGLSPYLRLSYATSLQAIEQGCLRIKQACGQLE